MQPERVQKGSQLPESETMNLLGDSMFLFISFKDLFVC